MLRDAERARLAARINRRERKHKRSDGSICASVRFVR